MLLSRKGIAPHAGENRPVLNRGVECSLSPHPQPAPLGGGIQQHTPAATASRNGGKGEPVRYCGTGRGQRVQWPVPNLRKGRSTNAGFGESEQLRKAVFEASLAPPDPIKATVPAFPEFRPGGAIMGAVGRGTQSTRRTKNRSTPDRPSCWPGRRGIRIRRGPA